MIVTPRIQKVFLYQTHHMLHFQNLILLMLVFIIVARTQIFVVVGVRLCGEIVTVPCSGDLCIIQSNLVDCVRAKVESFIRGCRQNLKNFRNNCLNASQRRLS